MQTRYQSQRLVFVSLIEYLKDNHISKECLTMIFLKGDVEVKDEDWGHAGDDDREGAGEPLK